MSKGPDLTGEPFFGDPQGGAQDPERGAKITDPASVKFKISTIIVGIVGGFVLSSVASIVAAELEYGSLRKFAHVATSSSISAPVTIASLVGLWIGLLAAVFRESYSTGTRSLRRDYGFTINWKTDLPLGVGIGVGAQIIILPLIYLPFRINNPGFNSKLSKPARELVGSAHGLELLVLGIFIAVGAPIVEELFFRGLMLRAVDAWIGAIWAVLISAVVFGLLHAEAIQTLGLVLFGVIQAIMALKLNRLGAGIISHATFNGIAVIALAASGH